MRSKAEQCARSAVLVLLLLLASLLTQVKECESGKSTCSLAKSTSLESLTSHSRRLTRSCVQSGTRDHCVRLWLARDQFRRGDRDRLPSAAFDRLKSEPGYGQLTGTRGPCASIA